MNQNKSLIKKKGYEFFISFLNYQQQKNVGFYMK